MTTPILILCPLFLPLLASWVIGGRNAVPLGGILGISCAFVFFGIGHYVQTDAMVDMLPVHVPFRREFIFASGGVEFAIAVGLLAPSTRRIAGWTAVAVLVAFFPANVYAALNYTGMGGHSWGPSYLLICTPLQGLLILWTLKFAILSTGMREEPSRVRT